MTGPIVGHYRPGDRVELGDVPLVLIHTTSVSPETDGRAIARAVVAAHHGAAPADVVIERDGSGKPQVMAPPTDVRINLSDADGHIAVAFGVGIDVGVDIERADRRTVEPQRFARRVLSAAEHTSLHGLEGPAFDHGLIRAWTRKEAVLKAAGHGLRRELAEIDTVPDIVLLDDEPWHCWTTDWDDLVLSIAWAQSATR